MTTSTTTTTQFNLADGGIETALEDRLGQELPEFAAFVLLDTEEGREALREYFRPFIELAVSTNTPLVLDTPTWRASSDWLTLLGYEASEVDRVNEAAVKLIRELVADLAPAASITLNGCIGPRFDDYVAEQRMTAEEARVYHHPQVSALAKAGVDRVTSVTTLDEAEAIGVVQAARDAGVPAAVSFTVGADGLMANGHSISDAIETVDAATNDAPVGFLVNCAHPSEVELALRRGGAAPHSGTAEHSDTAEHSGTTKGNATGSDALNRIIGFRLNAARDGDEGPGDAPESFAQGLLALRELAPNSETFGGCCGTDVPHIAQLAHQRS